MAKKFFYVCAGIFLLALSYHFGASTATAQAPSNPVVSVTSDGARYLAVTSNGDVYSAGAWSYEWQYTHNIFGAAPVTTTPSTWGSVKVGQR